ncbi:MAG: NADP-dependent oxidoreductase [Caulobacteraceae bacterium]|nr:NADP-dependent oxidoreductase [Caulobacteraceae bacterium]
MVVEEEMRTVRFRGYGEPAEVLRLERVAVPDPPRGRIRAVVHACGLNPADWALCRGLFAGRLPRGIGLEVSGVVDAVGEGVADVAVGDPVMGTPDWSREASAGASDRAILEHRTRIPAGLGPLQGAALPMAAETAYRSLESLGMAAGQVLMVHGAGTTVGFAAVQLALMRGVRVVATAGETYAGRLRDLGASVTEYGDGMVERVRDLVGGSPDFILDTAPPGGVLPDLVRIAGGDPGLVLAITDFESARALGVRDGIGEGGSLRYDMLPEFARWAADGRLTVPIARTFTLEDWDQARVISESGKARGKLLLLPGGQAAGAWIRVAPPNLERPPVP